MTESSDTADTPAKPQDYAGFARRISHARTVDYFVTRGRQSRTTLAPEIGWPLPGVLGVRSLGST